MKLFKHQSGALNPLLIVLIVVVLGAVGFAGYKVYDNQKKDDTNTNTSSSTELSKSEQKAVNQECKKQFNDDDFCKFTSNWNLAEKYESTISSKDADGSTSTTVMKVSGDDSSFTTSQDGKENAAYVSLAGVTYYKDYDANVWYKIPKAESSETNPETDYTKELDFDFDDTTETDNTTVKSLGKESCGNLTCFKYQLIDPSDTETKENLIWFDDKDYRLVRMMTTTNDGSVMDMAFAYPSNIEIKEPSPVQDMPTFDPSSLGTQ